MPNPAIDDELRDYLRTEVKTEFFSAITYRQHDRTEIATTAGRGQDVDAEGVVQRPYWIDVTDVPDVVVGETIIDDGQEFKIIEATTRPVGGMHQVLAEEPRIHAAGVPGVG